MRRAPVAILLVAALSATHAGEPAGPTFPAPAGWTAAGELLTFGRGDLWEYINGAADAFLAQGFRELRVRDLTSSGVTVTVAVYDMGTPLNAFGIYRSERPEGEPPVAAGAEATVLAPYQCLLLKDSYYVKVDVLEGDLSTKAGESLVRSLASLLPGQDGLPAPVRALPSRGRVAGSEGFALESYLGLSDLRGAVHATYLDEAGGEYPAFLLVPAADETLDDLWGRLAAGWQPVEGRGSPVLYRRIPYGGLVGVLRSGTAILGVAGAPNTEALLARLGRLARDE